MHEPKLGIQALYREKPPEYFAHVREDILERVGPAPGVVLELGCGAGATGAALKQRLRAKSVVGVEVFPEAAERASERLDNVLVCSIDDLDVGSFQSLFDTILAADVIEHLLDPWGVLEKCRAWLRPGGRIVASLPNFLYWRNLATLILRRDAKYSDGGIMDKTHLHIFTKRSITRAFRRAGFEAINVDHERLGWKSRWVNVATGRVFDDYLPLTWYVVAYAPGSD